MDARTHLRFACKVWHPSSFTSPSLLFQLPVSRASESMPDIVKIIIINHEHEREQEAFKWRLVEL